MRRRRKAETTPVVSHWLVTYSDMITLCLTFFVLLYSFSTLDAIKWKTVLNSVQGALGPLNSGSKPLDGETFGVALANGESENDVQQNEEVKQIEDFKKYQQETQKLMEIQAQLTDYFADKGLGEFMTINIEERGLLLRFEDSVLFVKGKADLLAESIDVLKKTGNILINVDNPIRIEGHTDDLAINTLRFPSNWELSTARATNVLRIFIEQGMDPQRLSAVGYGEYHPIVPNDDENSRKKNRRVDIVIIRGDMRFNEPK